MNEVESRSKVEKLVEVGRQLPQVPLPTKSFLLEGMYLRQCAIPAGTCFVGRVHKVPHYFLITKGSCGIHTPEGIKVIRAGMVFMSDPGVQRVGVTYEDCIFATIHRTEATNLKDIEDDMVEFSPVSRFGVGNEMLQKERLT
jgi:hypothetical protein